MWTRKTCLYCCLRYILSVLLPSPSASVHLGFHCVNRAFYMQFRWRMNETDNNHTCSHLWLKCSEHTASQNAQQSLNSTWISEKRQEFCFRLGCDWVVASLQHNTEGKDRTWFHCPVAGSSASQAAELHKTSQIEVDDWHLVCSVFQLLNFCTQDTYTYIFCMTL